jgi:hypothetical protein
MRNHPCFRAMTLVAGLAAIGAVGFWPPVPASAQIYIGPGGPFAPGPM